MADPLKIGVEVDTGSLSKLAEAAQQTATTVSSLAEQFIKGGLSAEEIAAAVTSTAASFVAANPAVQAQTTGLLELRSAVSLAQAALKQTGDAVLDESGKVSAGGSMLRQFAVESKTVADLQSILKAATQQTSAALTGIATASATAASGSAEQGAASVRAAESSAAQGVETKLVTASLSQAGQAAVETAAAILQGSEAAQIAGQRFASLSRDLIMLREQLTQSKAAMLEAGLSQEQLDARTAEYQQQLAAATLIQREATAAETQYKAALAESYVAVQTASAAKATAASSEASAARQKQDAMAAEAAANEGMVSAEVAQAEAALRTAEATSDQATAFSAAGQAALAMATEITQGSAAAREAGATLVALGRDIAIAKDHLVELKAATQDTSLTQQQLDAVTQEYLATRTQATLLEQQAAAVESDYKAALSESYAVVQAAAAAKRDAAAQEAAASQQKQAASQAAADAMAAEAAASEGMVSADLAQAEAENAAAAAAARGAEARRQHAAANAAAAAAIKENTAALAASVPASQASLSAAAKNAQTFMGMGMSAKEAEAGLLSMGNTAKEAAAAMAELGVATAVTSTETAGATAKMDSMTRALAYSGARLAANELGVGQLGFALARVGSISSALAPILAAAFPVFAAFALFQIVGSLTKTMEEWRDEVFKSAEEQAKWERTVLKSAEATDKMNEKLGGMAGGLAEDAERLAHFGDKTVDLTSDMAELNKRVEDGPSLWKSFKEAVGSGAVNALHVFDNATGDVERKQVDFNRSLATSIKTVNDLGPAIQAVTKDLKELQDFAAHGVNIHGPSLSAMGQIQAPSTTPFTEAQKKENERMIALKKDQLTMLTNMQESFDLERISMQEGISEKLFAAETRSTLARISLAEAEAKAVNKIHADTAADEMTELLRLNKERTDAELSEVTKKEELLSKQQKREPSVDLSGEAKALQEQKNTIISEGKRRELEIVTSTNAQILENNLITARAEVEAEEKVSLAHIKATEVQQRITFSRADSPAEIEAAAIPLIHTVTEEYQQQSTAIRATVTALLDKLAAERATAGLATPKPTATIGSDQYKTQLEAIKSIDAQLYAQLIAMNAEEITLRQRGASAAVEIENEKQRKIREVRSQELNNVVSGLNDQLVAERTSYQDGAIALKAGLSESRGHWDDYLSSIKELAQQNYNEQVFILANEADAVRAAADARVITEEDASRKLSQIWKREEEAFKEMHKREEEAARQTIAHEEQDVRTVSNKIADDFVKMGNKLLTTHTSVGRSAMELGRELEMYIIDQGIKKVVTHYATEVMQIVIADKIAEAQKTLIATQGAAIRTTIDTAALAKQAASQQVYATFTQALQLEQTTTHVAAQAAQTGATVTAVTLQTAAVQTGAATQQTVNALTALKTIASAAASAAAKAYEAMAGIPVVGPALGAAAAAATFAAVMAFSALGFERGGVVKANLHEGEMVLPSHLSSFVQSSAAAAAAPGGKGGAGGRGGDGAPGGNTMVTNNINHHHYNVRVDGATSKGDIEQMVHESLIPAIKTAHRRGMLPTTQ